MSFYVITAAEQDKLIAPHGHDISIGREGRGGGGAYTSCGPREDVIGLLYFFIGSSSRTSFCGEMFCFLLPEIHKVVYMFIRRTCTFCRVFSEHHVPSE